VKASALRIHVVWALSIVFMGCSMLPMSEKTSSSDSGLIGNLTSQLGVTNQQATGGAGAIFDYAKQKLSPADYSTVSKSLPEAESLANAAPKSNGMAAMLGGNSSEAGGIASLAGSFSQLGLSPDMIGQFLPVVLDYAKSMGGDAVANLLGGVLQ